MSCTFLVVTEFPLTEAMKKLTGQLLAETGITDSRIITAIPSPSSRQSTYYVKKPSKNSEIQIHSSVPEHQSNLRQAILRARPKCIITLGNIPFYMLKGEFGVNKWRGSQLEYTTAGFTCKLLPTLSPVMVMAKQEWKYHIRRDLMRAAGWETWIKPQYNFTLRPSFSQAKACLEMLLSKCEKGPTKLSIDIETRHSHIACCGIAWNKTDAICIPFIDSQKPDGYWSASEEFYIVKLMVKLFQHPNARTIFQNGAYDVQYFIRYWGCNVKIDHDTMIAHHTCWPGTEKNLTFLSAMYCEFHQYWKDDGRNFDIERHSEERLWEYNCKDCVVTYEIADELEALIPKLKLSSPADFQLHHQLPTTLRMMVRGIKRDVEVWNKLWNELEDYQQKLLDRIEFLVGRPVNPKSPKQMSDLLYKEFQQKVIIDRKSGNPTTNDAALRLIARRTPILKDLCYSILDYRSANVLKSTFLGMQLDVDGRIRCSYGVAGTETFRYNSSKNAFNSGGNLQNIPNPEKDKGEERFKPPNIKKMFIPDEGYSIADFDLDRADLQVVVWEADEPELKKILRLGIDIHMVNAKVLFNLPFNEEDLLDPFLAEKIAKKYANERAFAKAFVHGTNYGGGAKTMAEAAHCTILEAEAAQSAWFRKYPGIREWHKRVEYDLQTTRSVANKFGYRIYYFEDTSRLLSEALAWIPQSTVALVIDKGIVNVDENLRHLDCQPLLQVHDSGVFQYPTHNQEECLAAIKREMEIVIPYTDPLVIPVGAKVSDKSWGDCSTYIFNKTEAA